MVWEEKPAKRNLNNVVKVNVVKSVNLVEGDRILIGTHNKITGVYQVDEIIETRQSSLEAFNYVTFKSTYTKQ